VCLLINNCSWVINCESALKNLQKDKEGMKKALVRQLDDLKDLIVMVQGDLAGPVRSKIMCLVTMDAHSRDIIRDLITEGCHKLDDFAWQK